MLDRVIQQFKLKVLSIDEVEDSHSSTVYKCQLLNGETIFLKIPYTKLKYQRELEAYKILKDKVVTEHIIPDTLFHIKSGVYLK